MKKKYFSILIPLFVCLATYAQQDAQFSQYMFSPLFFNPGYAGSEGFSRFNLAYRNQWTGYNTSFESDGGGNPITPMFSFDAPIQSIRSGAGLLVLSDKYGPISNFQAQGSFAYHYPLRNGKLSIGIRGGVYAASIDRAKIRVRDPNDPIVIALTSENYSATALRPDMAFGIYYRTEKYYAGISVNHLTKSKINYGLTEIINALNNHLYITGGYTMELNYEMTFTPSVLIKSDLNTFSFDVNGLFTYNKDFWFGLGFRQGDAGIAMIGANMAKDKQGNKPLRVGYAFDFTIKGKDAKKPTSNEILLSYRLPSIPPLARQVTRTPRFRQQ
jgi:type IX secretion system PorP/SprF family membrane protein